VITIDTLDVKNFIKNIFTVEEEEEILFCLTNKDNKNTVNN